MERLDHRTLAARLSSSHVPMAEIEAATPAQCEAYLLGAAHDGSVSRRHRTLRIVQKDARWLDVLALAFDRVGARSWQYREGCRDVWTIESTFRPRRRALCLPGGPAAYARGYFDAEGGVPRDVEARFYIQFAQKDHADLAELRGLLQGLGIHCGSLHIPSRRKAPDYYRFYVASRSWLDFITLVGAWHPTKRPLLDARVSRLGSSGEVLGRPLCQ